MITIFRAFATGVRELKMCLNFFYKPFSFSPHFLGQRRRCTANEPRVACQIQKKETEETQIKAQVPFIYYVSHYEPKSPIRYDDINFVNFRFSKIFLAQIHPKTSYLHGQCLKRLGFVSKCKISLDKLALKHCFFNFELNLLSKKPEAKSKHFSETPFLEIFGKSFLLGLSITYQRPQK